MKIECAESAGFCFGVKRAVDTVYQLLDQKKENVYTLGPIIHNEQVVEDLSSRGVTVADTPLDIQEEHIRPHSETILKSS